MMQVSDDFIEQVAKLSMHRKTYGDNGQYEFCPLCNRQVSARSNAPIPHKDNCAWVIANRLILRGE